MKWLSWMAMQVSVAEAKNKLPELIKAVEEGKQVTIARRGVPVVDMFRPKLVKTLSQSWEPVEVRSRSMILIGGNQSRSQASSRSGFKERTKLCQDQFRRFLR
ncbi:MAG: type II toxin-antitoxin system prevent-host-death family antitoxin [Verrucomicrobia bacterium]|nr:type II toxin-antitoxin system prevent-host-death family antitoxin [Verrucomicrobiota bacterium]